MCDLLVFDVILSRDFLKNGQNNIKYKSHILGRMEDLIERAVEIILRHDWKSWKVYHYQMWRWHFWWFTLDEYKVWEDIVSSDLKQIIIRKIDSRVKEELKKQIENLIEKYDLILRDLIGKLIKKAREEREQKK